MLCEKCLKKEATVRYEEIINGSGRVMNLCHECSAKMGILNFSSIGATMENMMNDFMGGFVEDMISPFILGRKIHNPRIGFIEKNNVLSGEKCPRCGYTREYYINNGRGGCPECYGKIDTKERNKDINKKETEIKELEANLQKCIKTEDYEQAAKIRDKIKEMKKE